MKCGWSTNEEAVFVTDTGNVLVYDMFGELKKNFSMGQEAKDLKVISARVFQTQHATGVAVLTSSRRFFVVNNIQEPRGRGTQQHRRFPPHARGHHVCQSNDARPAGERVLCHAVQL